MITNYLVTFVTTDENEIEIQFELENDWITVDDKEGLEC